MAHRNASTALLTLLALAGCGGNNAQTGNTPYTADSRSSVEREHAVNRATEALKSKPALEATAGVNDLGFKLLRDQIDSADNVAISPVSVSFALAMAMNGAAGDTRSEMNQVLGVPKLAREQINESYGNLREVLLSADPKTSMLIANSVWARKGVDFDASFLQRVSAAYSARATSVDFSSPDAAKEINGWVSENTNKKIPSMVDKIPDDLVMYLINAVYFKGSWKDQFDPKVTTDRPFHPQPDKTTAVPTMARSLTAGYAKWGSSEVAALPFGNGRFQMVFVLPENTKDGLKKAVDGFSHKVWSESVAKLSPTLLELSIPKFKLEYETSLVEPLKELGMTKAFDAGEADFTELRKERDLVISEVKHKAVVEVDEEGAEAAAATSIGVSVTSVQVAQPFVLNRPFAFAITDTGTGAVLFLGVVRKPS